MKGRHGKKTEEKGVWTQLVASWLCEVVGPNLLDQEWFLTSPGNGKLNAWI